MKSEVAQLHANIERELSAMCQGLNGLAAGTAKHQFIEAKMKRLGAYQIQLASQIGEEQAIQISYEAYSRMMERKQS